SVPYQHRRDCWESARDFAAEAHARVPESAGPPIRPERYRLDPSWRHSGGITVASPERNQVGDGNAYRFCPRPHAETVRNLRVGAGKGSCSNTQEESFWLWQ